MDIHFQWSDMPIKKDLDYLCEHCLEITVHQCTIYKQVESRVCTRCGTRTDWEPGGARQLTKTSQDVPDHSIEDYDFKRAANRKYNTRRKP